MAKSDSKLIQLPRSAAPADRQLRILVVDDSPIQQLMSSLLLRQLGHVVAIAGDGFEALSMLQLDHRYDLILMDCQMPLMNGFQATAFIRKMEQITKRRLPIIGISATASAENCFASGMDDFLAKPLKKLIVQAVLGRWIRNKQPAPVRSIEAQSHTAGKSSS
jgi:CheY-like chemotaxis protein